MPIPDQKTIVAKLDELSKVSSPTTHRRVVHDLRGLIQALFIQIEVDQLRTKKQHAANLRELLDALVVELRASGDGGWERDCAEAYHAALEFCVGKLDALKHAKETHAD